MDKIKLEFSEPYEGIMGRQVRKVSERGTNIGCGFFGDQWGHREDFLRGVASSIRDSTCIISMGSHALLTERLLLAEVQAINLNLVGIDPMYGAGEFVEAREEMQMRVSTVQLDFVATVAQAARHLFTENYVIINCMPEYGPRLPGARLDRALDVISGFSVSKADANAAVVFEESDVEDLDFSIGKRIAGCGIGEEIITWAKRRDGRVTVIGEEVEGLRAFLEDTPFEELPNEFSLGEKAFRTFFASDYAGCLEELISSIPGKSTMHTFFGSGECLVEEFDQAPAAN